MFTIRTETSDLRATWSRRDIMRLGLGGPLAFWGPLAALGRLAPAAESKAAAPNFGQAKACIFIYLYGGPSHIDIWDMKPDAPVEYRGEFKPIDTNVPGIQICEHLPLLAQRADKLAIIRSLSHKGKTHGLSGYQMLTGHAPPEMKLPRGIDLGPSPKDPPHLGAVARRVLESTHATPAAVALPWQIKTQLNIIPGQSAGFLGRQFDPICVQYEDTEGKNFTLPNPGKLAEAVALERESDANRDRYGRNIFGQSLLLAKRLVESGVRVVTVYWPDRRDEAALFYNKQKQPVSVPMWDTHGRLSGGDVANFPSLKNRLLPPLDQASSALLDDLSASGRLNETLLVWTGEFGRTPKMIEDGRGHYTHCFSSMMAGGGIAGGIVHGASDVTASTPTRDPMSPADMFATMYHLLGVPADLELPGADGGAQKIITGNVVSGLID